MANFGNFRNWWQYFSENSANLVDFPHILRMFAKFRQNFIKICSKNDEFDAKSTKFFNFFQKNLEKV